MRASKLCSVRDMKANFLSIFSFLLCSLPTIVVLLLAFCYESTSESCELRDNARPGPSALVFLMLNMLISAVYLMSRRPAERELDFLVPLPVFEEVWGAVTEGERDTNHGDSVSSDDSNACSSQDSELDQQQKYVRENEISGVNSGDDDDDYVDAGELQRRSEEFIAKIIRGWMEEKQRDTLMRPP